MKQRRCYDYKENSIVGFCNSLGVTNVKEPENSPQTNKGCTVRPVNASVTAKQVSKMLLLVRSRGLVFTAIITCTLSTTVKGQAMLLMMIPNGTFASSSAVLLIFVTFVKLASKKLAMLIFSCFSRLWSPAWVIDKCFHFTFSHELHLRRKSRGNSKAELGSGSSVSRIWLYSHYSIHIYVTTIKCKAVIQRLRAGYSKHCFVSVQKPDVLHPMPINMS